MKYFFLALLITAGLIAASFKTNNKQAIASKTETNITLTPADITLTPTEESRAFPKAAITFFKYSIFLDTVTFEYKLAEYVLGNQTSDAFDKKCANSAKGQHIHLILNNEPYEAWYVPTFKKHLKEGHYVALSFLSRSYHESIKNQTAFVIRQFNVGKNAGSKVGDINLKQPLLFYSRPKGEYVGADTKKILLDFYLVNTKLSAKGNKIRATINGKEFMITDWKPYYIEGLPMGESTIKLELLDKNNKPANKVPMFQTIERKITLKEN